MTEYTDPSTIDVDVVRSEIDHSFRVRGHLWDETATWPNVTVKAMSDRIAELEQTSPEVWLRDTLAQAEKYLAEAEREREYFEWNYWRGRANTLNETLNTFRLMMHKASYDGGDDG